MDSNEKTIKKQPHHERKQLCNTRPSYRQGNKLTAVKVYTVSDESQHLIIRGVPSLNLHKELKNLCMRYGEVKQIHQVKDYGPDEESFTEVFHVTFARIQSARFAKHMIDDKSFYGGILHVCYAPELETVSQTRHKLDQRKHEVLKRLSQYTAADLKKSQILSQSTTEPVPGPSGISLPAVSTGYPSQHRFSNPNTTTYQFKKPINQRPIRKGDFPSGSGLSQANQSCFRNQRPRSQPPQVFIGPQLLPGAGTKTAEESSTKHQLRIEPNQDSSITDSYKKESSQETAKRTQPFNLSKFIPPQVKRIKFN